MAWEDLPRLELSRSARQALREKWKWGPCYGFEDDGLGFCLVCDWQHGGNQAAFDTKRAAVLAAIERLRASEKTDLFAEPVDVPAAIGWFLRWMSFNPTA